VKTKIGTPIAGDLVDQRLPLGVGELVGMGDGLGGGAAMLAGQVAGLRDLPDGEEGGFVKVQSATSGDVVHRLHETSCGIGAGRPEAGPAPGSELPFVIEQNSRLCR
jgi:hypothetical protein